MKKTISILLLWLMFLLIRLTSETVQSAALTFQSVDDVHGGDCLSLGMFSVCDSITNDVFKEHLQDTTGFFVDQARDTLDTSTTGQTTDCWLGDTLDVITKNFAMTFCASFTETFSSFSAASHVDTFVCRVVVFTTKVKTQMIILYENALGFIAFSFFPLTYTIIHKIIKKRLFPFSTLINQTETFAEIWSKMCSVIKSSFHQNVFGQFSVINVKVSFPLKKSEKNSL